MNNNLNILITTEFGSTLYGTRNANSDTDFKSIYLPTKNEILLSRYPKTIQKKRNKEHGERNTTEDIDIEIFSLDRFLYLLAEGQTVSLDILFSNLINIENEKYKWVWEEIINNKDKFLTKNLTAFIGYAKNQAAKYGVKGSRMDAVKQVVDLLKTLPLHSKLNEHKPILDDLIKKSQSLISLEKEPLIQIVMLPGPDKVVDEPHLMVCGRKTPLFSKVKLALEIYERIYQEYGERSRKASVAGGVDLKAIHHCIRVCSQGIELLETGKITFPRTDRQHLLDIKNGKYSLQELEPMIEQSLLSLTKASECSNIRTVADYDWIDNFICKVYETVVKST